MKSIYEELMNRGYIEYGKVIPINLIEKLIGYKSTEGWDFLGPYLQLRDLLQENGYFVTSKGCIDGSLRIFNVDEMSHKCEKNLDKVIRIQKRTAHVMSRADISLLNDRDKRKHELSLNKCIMALNATSSVLYNI